MTSDRGNDRTPRSAAHDYQHIHSRRKQQRNSFRPSRVGTHFAHRYTHTVRHGASTFSLSRARDGNKRQCFTKISITPITKKREKKLRRSFLLPPNPGIVPDQGYGTVVPYPCLHYRVFTTMPHERVTLSLPHRNTLLDHYGET